ncbi:MAG: dihydroneopterin aldolase [Bacteroidales bacterium]|nr:dihydroneopterin aldolase [Bacteroidales bacterium]
MAVITINGMQFYAFHGCFREEQAIGTRFRVDVAYETDTTKAQQSDNIEDTVSYLAVYRALKEEMEIPSHLLEHVADRIARRLLADFGAIERVEVSVSKIAPPLGGEMESVSVKITKDRFPRN